MTSLALDPALNHGCLVYATWDLTVKEDPRLIKYEVLVSWLQDTGIRVSIRDLQGITGLIIRKIKEAKKENRLNKKVGIDWDPNSVYWNNTSRLQAVKLAYLMGLISYAFLTEGLYPVFIEPSVVRTLMGHNSRTHKDQVLSTFRSKLNISAPPGDVYQDIQDALLLSYLTVLPDRQGFDMIFPES